MDWFDKIKSMDLDTFVKFLSEFDVNEFADYFCGKVCPYRNENNLNKSCLLDGENCKYENTEEMIKLWLKSKC